MMTDLNARQDYLNTAFRAATKARSLRDCTVGAIAILLEEGEFDLAQSYLDAHVASVAACARWSAALDARERISRTAQDRAVTAGADWLAAACDPTTMTDDERRLYGEAHAAMLVAEADKDRHGEQLRAVRLRVEAVGQRILDRTPGAELADLGAA